MRIHRRYLLNVARLAHIEQAVTESRVAILQDGTELPISRSGYARLSLSALTVPLGWPEGQHDESEPPNS